MALRTLRYDVVATSFPIVYTAEGDHDPAGLLYTLRTSQPLLDWARAQWEWRDEWLPRAHERRQQIELLIDALERYELMVARLIGTPDADLLGYAGPPGGLAPEEPPGEPDDLDDEPSRREKRQHLRHTVDEAAGLLRTLTDGAITALSGDARVRAGWRARWTAALPDLDDAIAIRLQDIQKDWEARLPRLMADVVARMADRRRAARIHAPKLGRGPEGPGRPAAADRAARPERPGRADTRRAAAHRLPPAQAVRPGAPARAARPPRRLGRGHRAEQHPRPHHRVPSPGRWRRRREGPRGPARRRS